MDPTLPLRPKELNARNEPDLSELKELTTFRHAGEGMAKMGQLPKKLSLTLPTPRKGILNMARRNARERNRVKQVNQGFLTLRHHIPEGFRMKKMSKVDTLRSALEYIRSLEEILVQVPAEHQSPFTEFEPCIFPPETEASLDSTKEN